MNIRISVAAFALCIISAPAFAHAHLKVSNPAADSSVASAPKELTLTFTEQLEPALSGVAVTNDKGQVVEAKPAVVSGDTMTVTVKKLPAGLYHVAWHAVAVDTHRTEGKYDFTIKP